MTTNFVDRWITYSKDRTEAPEIFHRYMAYMAVASVAGNRVWMPWTNGKLFPNLYLLFLSESASYKSTAIDMAKDVIHEVSDEIETPSDCTSASMANVFKKYKEGILCIDEFSTVLRAEDGHFSTVKTMLTSIYNCPRRYRLPYRMQDDTGDKDYIEHPVFNVVGATTPHTFVKDADIEDLKGGFLSRFITVTGKKSERHIPTPPGVDWGIIKGFASSLSQLRDREVWNPDYPVDITQSAKDIRHEWYMQVKALMDEDQDYIELSNSINRIRTYALKFAMLHSVIEGRDHMIEQEDMIAGIEIANSAIESAIKCMKNLEVVCSDDKWIRTLSKAEEYLSENARTGPVQKTDLYRAIKHISKREMDQLLATLVESRKIRIETHPNGATNIVWK
jgi:hypothetical protein